MQVGVLKETHPGERRVAIVPETVSRLGDLGVTVAVESGAGETAGFADAAYEKAGATIEPDKRKLCAGSGLLLKVREPTDEEIGALPEGSAIIAFLQPLTSPALVRSLAEHKLTSFSMELVPRITRAQTMDALSSQATVAGYKAVLLAAAGSHKFFPMLMTAAGTIRPARVLVLGVGVAGLQAIATARRLGAVVEGYDVRPDVKDQVESLGARWVGLAMEEAIGAGGYAKEISEEAQQKAHEHLKKLVGDADVVVTTAQIPGRKAPVLITDDMVSGMAAGSIIVDLAADSGGNCTKTRVGETTTVDGVIIMGPSDLPASMPLHASQMYSRNLFALAQHLVKEGELVLEMEDEITSGCLVTHGGEIVNERTRDAVQASA
ncbi:MAG: Re/Si-specific NAD(P)(+) transhydrogenase subunit alpha [Gemmatimonadota bacterium]|jgi:NAD(P) transhydrogenase subunit alpha